MTDRLRLVRNGVSVVGQAGTAMVNSNSGGEMCDRLRRVRNGVVAVGQAGTAVVDSNVTTATLSGGPKLSIGFEAYCIF